MQCVDVPLSYTHPHSFVCVSVCVCVLDTWVRCAKAAELIDMTVKEGQTLVWIR